MIDKETFNEFVKRAMVIDGRVHMRPVVEKELLHYDILFALDQGGLPVVPAPRNSHKNKPFLYIPGSGNSFVRVEKIDSF